MKNTCVVSLSSRWKHKTGCLISSRRDYLIVEYQLLNKILSHQCNFRKDKVLFLMTTSDHLCHVEENRCMICSIQGSISQCISEVWSHPSTISWTFYLKLDEFWKTQIRLDSMNAQTCLILARERSVLSVTHNDVTCWNDQTNKMTCAPSEGSYQPMPGHPPSLIRIFAVRLKKPGGPLLPTERTAKTLIRLGRCPGWSRTGHSTGLFFHARARLLKWLDDKRSTVR